MVSLILSYLWLVKSMQSKRETGGKHTHAHTHLFKGLLYKTTLFWWWNCACRTSWKFRGQTVFSSQHDIKTGSWHLPSVLSSLFFSLPLLWKWFLFFFVVDNKYMEGKRSMAVIKEWLFLTVTLPTRIKHHLYCTCKITTVNEFNDLYVPYVYSWRTDLCDSKQ